MIKLFIDNSESRIEGLSVSQYAELRGLLSYSISAQQSHFSHSFNNKRYLINKRGEFPSGLTDIVISYLRNLKNLQQYHISDLRMIPISTGLFKLSLPYDPYPEQEAAAETCLLRHRGIVSACTGFGKSFVMALLINKLQLKTLIIVPNLELKNQLISGFSEYFKDLTNITIENIDSKRLPKLKDFDCLIIDEAHHAAAKTYRDLNKKAWGGIFHRYFFTATPFRSRNEENILFESIAGQVIYTVSYKTAVDKGYIVAVEAYYIDMPYENLSLLGNYASAYKKGVVQSHKLNELVAELLSKLHENKLSTLCIVREIEHGENLVNLSGAAFANGQSEDCRALINWFSSGKLKTLIGTHGVVGEGVDTRACEYVVLPIPVKSKNLFMQIIGRAVRRYSGKDSAKIILFNNRNHKWFKAAFKEQCKILADEFGIIPTKLDI